LRRILALLALAGCGSDDGRPTECVVPDGVEVDWIGQLGCEDDYQLLWNDDQDAVFAHTRSVNWIIDREDDDAIYFIDTTEFLLHYFFAARYLDYGEPYTPVGTHTEFNILNYRRENRRFLMGKVVRYLDQDLLTIEFAAGDTATADMIADGFERVSRSIYDGDRLVYRPVSATQEEMLPELEARIPVIRTDAVFQGQTYQPLNQRVGYGTLRFRHLVELGAEPLSPTDIVVLDRVPNDITLVSGIITEEFQTPLSHVNVLSKNRGTPNMALRGAFADPDLRALEDSLVRLEVTPQDFTIAEAAPAGRSESQ
jgi:hypothetical protein